METEVGTGNKPLSRWMDRLPPGLMVAALVLTGAAGVLRILTHHPFHDEIVHVRMLWLLSTGLVPHVDYWCNYPALGYVLTVPVIQAFPISAWIFLVLRFFTFGLTILTGVLLARHGRRVTGSWIWGVAPLALLLLSPPVGRFLAEYSIDHFATLAAVAAMTLFFRRPTPFRIGIATALGCASVLFTPKFGLPLAAGLTGMCLGSVLDSRRIVPTLAAAAAGVGAAVLAALLLYGIGGVSPWLNLRYAHVFMAEYKLTPGAGSSPVSTFATVGSLFARNVPLLLLCAAGLVGWVVVRSRSGFRSRGPAPLGLLLGTLGAVALVHSFMIQYLFPVLLCLSLFVPFAHGLSGSARAARPITLIVAIGVLIVAGLELGAVPSEFERTPNSLRDERSIAAGELGVTYGAPAVEYLATTQWLLDLIPEDERVVATPHFHPMFRRDLTFITSDEDPSFSTMLEDTDPVRRRFEPGYLRSELEAHPPAYICLTGLELSYPPGWKQVCVRFLQWHRDRYSALPGHPTRFLRNDLLE